MFLMEDDLILLASHVWYGSVRRTATQLLSQSLPKISLQYFVK